MGACCKIQVDENGYQIPDVPKMCIPIATRAACETVPENKWTPGKTCAEVTCLFPDLDVDAGMIFNIGDAPITIGWPQSVLGSAYNVGEAPAHNVTLTLSLPSPMIVDNTFGITAFGGSCTVNGRVITCTTPVLNAGESLAVYLSATIPETTSPRPYCHEEFSTAVSATTTDTEVRYDNNAASKKYFVNCGVCCPHVNNQYGTCGYYDKSTCEDNPFDTLPPTWLPAPNTCQMCPKKSSASSASSSSKPTSGKCCTLTKQGATHVRTIEPNVTQTQCEIVKKGVYNPGNPPDSDVLCPVVHDLGITKIGPGVTHAKPGDTLSYSVTITNNSDVDIPGQINFSDNADLWLKPVDPLPSGCRKLSTLISCTFTGLAARATSSPFVFTFTVEPSACPNGTTIRPNAAYVFGGPGIVDDNIANNTAFSDKVNLICGTAGICCTYASGKPDGQCVEPSTSVLCTGTNSEFIAGKTCAQGCPTKPVGVCCPLPTLTGGPALYCQKNVTASGCSYGDFKQGVDQTKPCAEICSPPTYGTCCTLSGCDAKVTESQCTMKKGRWSKPENKCADCPDLGACCFGVDTAQCKAAQTQSECTSAGGSWTGKGSQCLSCQYNVGVCCGEKGQTTEGITESACKALTEYGKTAVWISGKDKNSCPKPGACCSNDYANDNCSQLTYAACKDQFGIGAFRGDGVACPSSCKPAAPKGACCRAGYPCQEGVTKQDCDALMPVGHWSEKKTCAEACPTGACCYVPKDGGVPACKPGDNKYACDTNGSPSILIPGASCSVCQKHFCYRGGGDAEGTKSCHYITAVPGHLPYPDAVGPFDTPGQCVSACPEIAYCCDKNTNQCMPSINGVNCASGTRGTDNMCGNACPQPPKGACCVGSTCTETSKALCGTTGWKGDGSSCATENICGTSTNTKACCTGNACSEKTFQECQAGGGIPQGASTCGDGSICTKTETPKPCCLTGVARACQMKTPTECNALKGAPPKNGGDACAIDSCPVQVACGPGCKPAVNGVCSIVQRPQPTWWASLLAQFGLAPLDFPLDLDFDGTTDCCCKPTKGSSSSAVTNSLGSQSSTPRSSSAFTSSQPTASSVATSTSSAPVSSKPTIVVPACYECASIKVKSSCMSPCMWKSTSIGPITLPWTGSCVKDPMLCGISGTTGGGLRSSARSSSKSASVSSTFVSSVSMSSASSKPSIFVVFGNLETCGDGTVGGLEQCDDGRANVRARVVTDETKSYCNILCRKPACDDTKDNDGDGRIDRADPGCYRVVDPLLSWDWVGTLLAQMLPESPMGEYLPGRNSESCAAGMAENDSSCVSLSCPPEGVNRPMLLRACAEQCGTDQRCIVGCTCKCANDSGNEAGMFFDRCMKSGGIACGDEQRPPNRSREECCKLSAIGATCSAN